MVPWVTYHGYVVSERSGYAYCTYCSAPLMFEDKVAWRHFTWAHHHEGQNHLPWAPKGHMAPRPNWYRGKNWKG